MIWYHRFSSVDVLFVDNLRHGVATEPYNDLNRLGLLANQVSFDSLSFEEAHTLLFETWLPQAGRTVSSAPRQVVLNRIQSPANGTATVRERIGSPEPLPHGRGTKNPVNQPGECRSPLYLKMLIEEAKLWRSDDEPTEPDQRWNSY